MNLIIAALYLAHILTYHGLLLQVSPLVFLTHDTIQYQLRSINDSFYYQNSLNDQLTVKERIDKNRDRVAQLSESEKEAAAKEREKRSQFCAVRF